MMSDETMKIIKILWNRAGKKSMNLKSTQLSKILGVSRQTIYNLEKQEGKIGDGRDIGEKLKEKLHFLYEAVELIPTKNRNDDNLDNTILLSKAIRKLMEDMEIRNIEDGNTTEDIKVNLESFINRRLHQVEDTDQKSIWIISKQDHMQEAAIYLKTALWLKSKSSIVIDQESYLNILKLGELPEKVIWLSGGNKKIDKSYQFDSLTDLKYREGEGNEFSIRQSSDGNLVIIRDFDYWLDKNGLFRLAEIYLSKFFDNE